MRVFRALWCSTLLAYAPKGWCSWGIGLLGGRFCEEHGADRSCHWDGEGESCGEFPVKMAAAIG